jgi:hypothetical protein
MKFWEKLRGMTEYWVSSFSCLREQHLRKMKVQHKWKNIMSLGLYAGIEDRPKKLFSKVNFSYRRHFNIL